MKNSNSKDILYLVIIICLFWFGLSLSSCYTITKVGSCKYYHPKFKSSRYTAHKPVSF